MVGDPREGPPGVRRRVRPGVLDVERRAVVDEPQAAVPDQQVDVLGRPVDVRDEGVEPDDVGREVGIRAIAGRCARRGRRTRLEGQRARQEVEAQVQARAPIQQLLDLLVRLGPAEGRIELDEDDLGDRQPERPADLAGDELGDQRLRPLAGPAVLHDVQPVVVRLHQSGQRATLAERRDVAGGGHGPDGDRGRGWAWHPGKRSGPRAGPSPLGDRIVDYLGSRRQTSTSRTGSKPNAR